MLILFGYMLLGAVAGLIAGVFGLGGGIIIVPSLIFTFSYLNFPHEVLTHLAVGTSLSTILFTSLSAIYVHNKNILINWSLAFKLSIGLLLGGVLSAYFAEFFTGGMLQKAFAIYCFTIAVQMWFSWQPQATLVLPKKLGLACLGTLIGFISGLFGIAGGSLVVPVLTLFRVKMLEAVSTAAVTGFPIALSGTISYIFMGWSNIFTPEYSLGYIYLPATLGIIITSTVFARIGAKLVHTLPVYKTKKAFAIVLLLIACKLFY
jgi:uncharacterized membrane protein YfcA